MEKSNVRLDTNSGNGKPEQQRELDSAMEMGQSLAGSKNKGASYIETEGVVLLDTFRGDIFQLIDSIKSLVELDMMNALVPHGIGGHARNLLSSAAIRLEQLRQRVAELEENWRLSEIASAKRQMNVIKLTAERDALKKLYESSEEYVIALKETRNRLAEERDEWRSKHDVACLTITNLQSKYECQLSATSKVMQGVVELTAERDALKQQRDELLAALECRWGPIENGAWKEFKKS